MTVSMTPALRRVLQREFRTLDIDGIEMSEEPWNYRVRFQLGNRCTYITGHVMRTLFGPPPDPMTEGLMALFDALWDSEKRLARHEGREPSATDLTDRFSHAGETHRG